MNPADPFYTGGLPGPLLLVVSIAVTCFIGWLLNRGEKF